MGNYDEEQTYPHSVKKKKINLELDVRHPNMINLEEIYSDSLCVIFSFRL